MNPALTELLKGRSSPKPKTDNQQLSSNLQDILNKYKKADVNQPSTPAKQTTKLPSSIPITSQEKTTSAQLSALSTRMAALPANQAAQDTAALVMKLASAAAVNTAKPAQTIPSSNVTYTNLIQPPNPRAVPAVEEQPVQKPTTSTEQKAAVLLQQQAPITTLPTQAEREAVLDAAVLNAGIQEAADANMELTKAGIKFPEWYFCVQNQSDLISRSFMTPECIQRPIMVQDPLLQEHLLVSDCIAIFLGCMQTTYIQVNKHEKEYTVTLRKEVASVLPLPLIALTQRVLLHANSRFQIVATIHTNQTPEYGRISNAFSQALRCIIKEYDFYLANLSSKHYGKMQTLSTTGNLSLQKLEAKLKQIHLIFEHIAKFCANLGVARGCALIQQLETAVLQSSGLAVRSIFNYLLAESLKPLGRIIDRFVNEAVIAESDEADCFIKVSPQVELGEKAEKTGVQTWSSMFTVDSQHVPHFLNNVKTQLCDIGRCVVMLNWKQKQYMERQQHRAKEGDSGATSVVSPGFIGKAEGDKMRFKDEPISFLVCGNGMGEDLELMHIRLYKRLIDMAASTQTNVLDFFINSEYLDLRGHLQTIYAFYLVMAGDFLSCFLESAMNELVLSKSSANLLRIRNKFKIVVNTSSLAKLTYRERVNVVISPELFKHHLNMILYPQTYTPNRSTDSPDPKVLNLLGLQYDVSYPLNLVLTTSVMERLGVVFRHILRAKISEIELQKAWTTLQKLRKLERVPIDKIESCTDTLPPNRNPMVVVFGIAYQMLINMLDFIHSLQFHMFTVLSNCISKYHEELDAAKCLDDLVSSTAKFSMNLLDALGLSSEGVVINLETLFNDCMVYAHHIVKTFYIVSSEDDSFIQQIATVHEEERGREGRERSKARAVKSVERMTTLLRKRELIEFTRLTAIANNVYRLMIDNRLIINKIMDKFSKGLHQHERLMQNFRDRQ